MIFDICLKAGLLGTTNYMKNVVYLAIFSPLSRETSLRIWKYERFGQQKPSKKHSQASGLFHKRIYFLKQLLAWGLRITVSRIAVFIYISASTFEELCCILPSFVHFHRKDADTQLTTLEHLISARVQNRTIISEVFCLSNLSDSKWLKLSFITGYVN